MSATMKSSGPTIFDLMSQNEKLSNLYREIA